MSFTNAQKVDIRRFCGYMAYGVGQAGFQGWRFFQAYGLMEFRLNNFAPEEETVITTIYLANLYSLETAIVGTSANLDTAKAAVWEHNQNELRDRDALFANWRRKLCDFIGVPPGEGLQGGSGMRLVV
jgi:hypothetical protein